MTNRQQPPNLAGDLLSELVSAVQDNLPGPSPIPTLDVMVEFANYDLAPDVEPALGFHFPPEVLRD
jgi:hypothetical protein